MNDRRVASLDLLRGCAAFAVAIPHLLMMEGIGERAAETISILGVEVFFALSGFVLAPQILFFVLERPSVANLGIFLVRRWMRTVPAYAVALVLTSVLAHELFSADFFRYLFYVQNLIRQSNTNDYFAIAWSLSVEEWFYLTFPLFLLVALAITRRSLRAVVGAALVYISAVCLLRMFLGDAAHWGEDVRRVVVFRVDAIVWGFLLSILLMRTKLLLRIRLVWLACGFLIVTVASILLTSQAAGSSMIEAAFPFYAAMFGALAIALAVKIEPVFRKSSTWTAAADFLGRISYSVYLFHLLALGAISPLGGPLALQLVVFVGLTVTIAFLVYTAIEAPILARRPRFLSEANSLIGESRLPSQI